jgi:hypothetical protein
MIRGGLNGLHRAAHRQMGGAQDVEAVDFRTVDEGHGPDDVRMLRQDVMEGLAPGRGEFFGIIQARAAETGGQNDGRSGDRSGQRPAARFVHTGNTSPAAAVEKRFTGQIGHASETIHPLAHGELRMVPGREKLRGENHAVGIHHHADSAVGPFFGHIVMVIP